MVAALEPPAVYHWYVIFAIGCFLAWTKMDSLGGKVWLAIGAALSLSLGLIFPLQFGSVLLAREHPYALASLYFGGGMTGWAYVLFSVCGQGSMENWRPTGLAKNLLVLALLWVFWLAARPWLASHFSVVPAEKVSLGLTNFVAGGMKWGLGILLVILSGRALHVAKRGAFLQTRMFALSAIPAALLQTLLTQLVFN